MAQRSVQQSCLSCKFFRPTDVLHGKCRVDKETLGPGDYPVKRHGDICPSWQDTGQQYYIRCGWVKGLQMRAEEESGQ